MHEHLVTARLVEVVVPGVPKMTPTNCFLLTLEAIE